MRKLSATPTPLYRLSRFTCLLLALVFSAQASAERWYRVELLAFSQRGGELAETWPATPDLAYPEEGRFLMHANELSAQAQPAAGQEAHAEVQDNTGSPDDSDETRPHFPPFVMLPEARKGFGDTATSMARSGRYKVLFHETWIQPVGSKRSALPLILDRSGDTGKWPELQGSIKLWLSRYLHLETNLWLNTSGDYLRSEWQMPAAPLGPAAVPNSDGNALYAQERQRPGTDPATENSAAESTDFYWTQNQSSEPIESLYPYRHAIALQQKRRMRSKEIHYIDHPLLGLMIKLTPLKTSED